MKELKCKVCGKLGALPFKFDRSNQFRVTPVCRKHGKELIRVATDFSGYVIEKDETLLRKLKMALS